MSLTFQSLRAFLGTPSPPGAMMAFTSQLPAGGGAGEVACRGDHRAARPAGRRGGDLLAGVVASAGLAIGVTVRMAPAVCRLDDRSRGGAAERAALAQALQEAVAEIGGAVKEALASGLDEQAGRLAARAAWVEDPALVAAAEAHIAAGRSAAYAWAHALRARSRALRAAGRPWRIERIAGLRDVGRQVLRHLASRAGLAEAGSWSAWPPGAVLLADDLVPADFRAVAQARVAAIVLARGGPASQVAMLARAGGVPLLVALGPRLQALEAGHTVVVDAEQGVLELAPDVARLKAVRLEAVAQRRSRAERLAAAQAGARTADGVCIPVSATVADADEAARARRLGAQGVGQLRTESGFLERATAPSLAAQQAHYQAVLDAVPGCSVAIRTLDLGSEDAPACLPLPAETNPALGLRGIRLGLVHGWLLDAQLDAILTLRPLSAVRVMLPMVVELAELRRVRARLDELAAVRGVARRVPLGVVIETPAAALLAGALAREADFFCIGSSELAQYTLCMDRGHPALAARLDGLHPAVLHMVGLAAEGAARHGRALGVCGALACDVAAVPLLVGLGATELSVSPAMVPRIRSVLCRLDTAACRRVALQARAREDAPSVRALVARQWPWLAEHALPDGAAA